MATKKGRGGKLALEVGAGVLAAAAAAGAGYYYFYADKNAKKHRQAASTWAKGMKADVVREAKKLKKLDQKVMAKVVDRAAAVYQGARSVDASDVRKAAAELKRHWREIEREIKGAARKTVATRPAKKRAAKKAPAKKVSASRKKSARKAAKRSR